MEIVDLKSKTKYLEQYVQLRNQFCELLLTEPVTLDGTKQWLQTVDVEIRGIIEDNMLLGCAILYIGKNGEVTFFARDNNRGIGTQLLGIIEDIAVGRKLKTIWSWVLEDNRIAQRVFEKCGFLRGVDSIRRYRKVEKNGITFIKKII